VEGELRTDGIVGRMQAESGHCKTSRISLGQRLLTEDVRTFVGRTVAASQCDRMGVRRGMVLPGDKSSNGARLRCSLPSINPFVQWTVE
jgi:hypothetical protein